MLKIKILQTTTQLTEERIINMNTGLKQRERGAKKSDQGENLNTQGTEYKKFIRNVKRKFQSNT